eukprot:gnl/Dysnectes_brevis/1042_a1162_3755.p1 GENE.gnl/Dysnectes_brevis/1042_a1162_3755~~gnl/Dysnectes_brevis/1042_a1162_3755.p1  ORF type:complete len:384 (+),score=98.93 gnl/Dysnectes_brevis/1042_a1162_3755:28-1179(+)
MLKSLAILFCIAVALCSSFAESSLYRKGDISDVYDELPNVYVILTGGTISMRKDDQGEYVPSPGYLEYLTTIIPYFNDDDMPTFYINEYDPMLDSSNMKPKDWLTIAQDIEDNYDDYDGFVVIHGTDTMAYTSSALSFLLDGLNKTVVVTGSQIPMCETFNDGVFNLIGAIWWAGYYQIPEVTVFFASHLLRGNRVQKYTAWALDAFNSAQFPSLGEWGANNWLNDDEIRPFSTKPLSVPDNVSDEVEVLYLHPGVSGDDLLNMVSATTRGVLMLAFGTGNGPSSDQSFVDALTTVHQSGVVILDATSTYWGQVDLGHYETGGAMRRAGAVSAYTMTPEAAYSKLCYLLGLGLTQAEVENMVEQNLRGELDIPEASTPWTRFN